MLFMNGDGFQQIMVNMLTIILFLVPPSSVVIMGNDDVVIQLNRKKYYQTIESGNNSMIKFYQPWCANCIRIKSDWEELAKATTPYNVVIADVNCGEEKDLCDEVGIVGYPTLRYIIQGEEHSYSDGRGFEALLDFTYKYLIPKCIPTNLENTCSEKSQVYVRKWTSIDKTIEGVEKELIRLEKFRSKPYMKIELKHWINERIIILKQIGESMMRVSENEL